MSGIGRPIEDYEGRIYGSLHVTSPGWRSGDVTWVRVRCDCGVEKTMRVTVLQKGAKSCGCRRYDGQRQAAERRNRYTRATHPTMGDAKALRAWLEKAGGVARFHHFARCGYDWIFQAGYRRMRVQLLDYQLGRGWVLTPPA